MKQVAGRLKLDLSQYRELEAFAQFGSDLDAETQRTLARGERLVATLNQNERQPLPVEDQVVQIYAATNGYLDRIKVDRVPEFLADLVRASRAEHADLLEKIAGGDWADENQRGGGQGGPGVRRRLRLRPRRGGPADATRATPTASPASATRSREAEEEQEARRAAGAEQPARRQGPHRSVKNIQKITRAMEMVAAARLRRAEQRIEALRPYADAIRRMTRQAAEAADNVPNLPILAEHERAEHGRPAAGHRRPRPGRRVQLADPARRDARGGASTRPRAGASVWYASGRRGVSSLTFRGLERRRRLHRLHRPARLRRRARDRRRPDGRLRRREGRPGRDLLQRLHLAALPGGPARDPAAAAAGVDPRRGRGGRVRRASRPERARWSSTSPTRRRSSSASCPTTWRSPIYRALLESTASEHGARMTAMRSAVGERRRAHRRPDAGDEPRPPGRDHPGDHGSRRRRGSADAKENAWKPAPNPVPTARQAGDGDQNIGRHRGDPGRRDRGRVPRPACPRSTTRSRSSAPRRPRRRSRTASARGTSKLVCEVQQHLGDDRVRAVAMDTTDGLARGMEVIDTGGPITVPVGEADAGPHLQPARRADRPGRAGRDRGALADPPARARRSRTSPRRPRCSRPASRSSTCSRPTPRAARSACSAAPAWARPCSSRS